jgi:hypothetical protein
MKEITEDTHVSFLPKLWVSSVFTRAFLRLMNACNVLRSGLL